MRAIRPLQILLSWLLLGGIAWADSFVAYNEIQDEGTAVTPRRVKLNLIGAGVSCVDSTSPARTNCTISGGGSGNSFETIDAPAGTDPVASSSTDTLTLTDGLGFLITGTAASDTLDFSFDYTNTLAGNPAMAAETVIFTTDGTGGGLLFEGADDTIEGLLVWNPSTSDRTLTLPDVSGNVVVDTASSVTSVQGSGLVVSAGVLAWQPTEISSLTWGTGSFTTMTFDAGASDPVLTASSGFLDLTTGTLRQAGVEVCLEDGTNCPAAGAGDVTSVGDCLTGACFTGSGTASTSLTFDRSLGDITLSYNGSSDDMELSNDLNLIDLEPHLTFDPTTAGHDSFHFYAFGDEFYFTNLTALAEIFRVDTSNRFRVDSTTLVVDMTNNYVGIGTLAPNHTLDIVDAGTDAGADAVGIEVNSTVTYDNSGARDAYGIETNITSAGAANNTLYQAGGVFKSTHAGTGTVSVFGTYNQALNTGSGDSSNAYGSYNLVESGGAGSVITNAYGLLSYINDSSAGTIGNMYGLYLDRTGTGTTATYGVFQLNNDPNFFEGSLQLGTDGVQISDDADGTVEFLGRGTGSDECLAINLDDTANVVALNNCASSSGVATLVSAFDIEIDQASPHISLNPTTGDTFGFHVDPSISTAFINNETDSVMYLHFGSSHIIDIGSPLVPSIVLTTSGSDVVVKDDMTIIDPSSSPHLQLCTASSTKCVEWYGSTAGGITLSSVTDSRVLLDLSEGDAAAHVPSLDAVRLRTSGMACGGTLSTTMDCEDFKTRIPANCTVQRVSLQAGTAPTTQAIIVDVNECNSTGASCTTIDTGTKPQIAAGATSGEDTTVTDTVLTQGNFLQFDIDQVGSGTTGADLTVTVSCLF